jgi:hypothetical protein
MAMVLLAAATATAQAQGTVPRVTLSAGGVDVYANRSLIAGMHELPDGRVLIVQTGSPSVLRLDLRGAKTDTVFTLQQIELPPQMQSMSGMAAATMAGFFVPAPADRPAIHEVSQKRIVFIDPAGGAPRFVPVGTGNAAALPASGPIGVDGQGRLFLMSTGMSMTPGSPSPIMADTVAIMRARDGGTGTDTLLLTRNPATAIGPRVEQSVAAITMVATTPDGRTRDSFTVLRDGRIALISGDDYRVRFIAADKSITTSAPIPTTPVPVTPQMMTDAADSTKRTLDNALAQAKQMMASVMAEVPPEALAMMPQLAVRVDAPQSMATTLPAHTALRESASGLLWVTVPGDLNGRVLRYDVLDAAGTLRAHVTLPDGESLAGISAAWVYTMRMDAPAQARLRRYPLPTALKR